MTTGMLLMMMEELTVARCDTRSVRLNLTLLNWLPRIPWLPSVPTSLHKCKLILKSPKSPSAGWYSFRGFEERWALSKSFQHISCKIVIKNYSCTTAARMLIGYFKVQTTKLLNPICDMLEQTHSQRPSCQNSFTAPSNSICFMSSCSMHISLHVWIQHLPVCRKTFTAKEWIFEIPQVRWTALMWAYLTSRNALNWHIGNAHWHELEILDNWGLGWQNFEVRFQIYWNFISAISLRYLL